jgi:hypothetical protein
VNWKAEARAAIERAYADGVAAGLTGRELRNHVNAAYPFGARERHPYKVWCAEMKQRFGEPTRGDRQRLAAWNNGEKLR